MISMIAAVGKNMEIGKGNTLIWHIPKDMKFFKETTLGHTVVMGRKTYESLPAPLSNRKMVIISSHNILDVDTVGNIDDILNKYMETSEEIFIIGGASIYKQFIEYADKLYLTEIDSECLNADSYFPKIDKNMWKKEIIDSGIYEKIKYKICKYVRKVR